MKYGVELKPRTTSNLPPEKLAQILGTIYPEEIVGKLMEELCDTDGERNENESCID